MTGSPTGTTCRTPSVKRASLVRRECLILPLADNVGLGVRLTRPLGVRHVVRRPADPAELAPLRRFEGMTCRQALINGA